MIPENVKTILNEHGLRAIEFAEGTTPTAPLAAEALGVEVGQIAKSLLLKGKDDRFRMVICPGDRKISNSRLKQTTGVKTRMATADETRNVTGFAPGGVCPFGVDRSVEILIDQSLAEWQTIYPAAGTDCSGVPMTFEQLRAVTGGRLAQVTEPA
jgi:prolyl-tRNA editing enzyme YbaK/EbsC (Cys-tRNA(Pro) deacylase)